MVERTLGRNDSGNSSLIMILVHTPIQQSCTTKQPPSLTVVVSTVFARISSSFSDIASSAERKKRGIFSTHAKFRIVGSSGKVMTSKRWPRSVSTRTQSNCSREALRFGSSCCSAKTMRSETDVLFIGSFSPTPPLMLSFLHSLEKAANSSVFTEKLRKVRNFYDLDYCCGGQSAGVSSLRIRGDCSF